MQCDSATSPGQNSSADSTQSSPFSSAVSESEVDASSLSCQSSCSSLNQQNATAAAAVTSSVADTKQPFSNGGHPVRNTLRIGNKSMADVSRMRPACLNPGNTSDEDAAAEDTTNNGFWGQFRCERRNTVEQSGITWRSRSDTGTNCTERGRKTSLPRPLTPSPSVSGRSSPACLSHPVPPRSRVADIRRESNCSMESEAAHERLMQIAQQVSLGFDDFCIGDSAQRKRTHSLSEPISVLTNAFIPNSCSPSPTRGVDAQKQCYSPSTRQIVRNNITYSPSPSPTPSPTRHIMRSLSPMAVRQVTKRRYTSSANVEADASDLRTPGMPAAKRVCQQPALGCRICPSPLAVDSSSSSVDSLYKSPEPPGPFSLPISSRFLVDPAIGAKLAPPMELDEEGGDSSNEQRPTSSAASEDSADIAMDSPQKKEV